MKIDLACLTDIGSHKRIEKWIELPNLTHFYQDIETPFPFQIKLEIYNTRDSFMLTGQLTGRLVLTCNRCLEKFNFAISLVINEEFLKKAIPNPEHLDISNIIFERILLDIPMKAICNENCKGLCSFCGQNLNNAECDCNRASIDPRLVKLKDFFSKDDEYGGVVFWLYQRGKHRKHVKENVALIGN